MTQALIPQSWLPSWIASVNAPKACLLTRCAALPGTLATPASLPV